MQAATVHLARFEHPLALDRRPQCNEPSDLARWLVGSRPYLGATGVESDQTIWTVIGMWKQATAAVRSLDDIGALLPWFDDAEQWHAALRPIRAIGTCDHTADGAVGPPGWEVQEPSEAASARVLSITSAGYEVPHDQVDPNRLVSFFLGNKSLTENVVPHAVGNLGHRDVMPFCDAFDGMNVSLWEDAAALSAYAYRAGPHKEYVDKQHTGPGYFDRSSFTRFEILRAAGTLQPWASTPVEH